MQPPAEPEPNTTPLREIFGRQFWLNYAIGLLITIWIPLVRVQVMIDDKPQGAPQYLPMYKVYKQIWDHPTHPSMWKFAAAHWGITFIVMALVWWGVLRRAPAKRPLPAVATPTEQDHG